MPAFYPMYCAVALNSPLEAVFSLVPEGEAESFLRREIQGFSYDAFGIHASCLEAENRPG
jgi:hypothetical protein